LKRINASVEPERDRRQDAGEAQAVPRFVADALAWMEIQRAGLARLREYQLEEAVCAPSGGANRRMR
jgi:hypothetical protein